MTPDEVLAACGPVAAVKLASAYGRSYSVDEALGLARQVGWTLDGGMNGTGNELRLLQMMGVPAILEGSVDWSKVQGISGQGVPVIISTTGHYFVADGYDGQTGQYHVGDTGTAYRLGATWMTADQMQGLAGSFNGALYLPGGGSGGGGGGGGDGGGGDTDTPPADEPDLSSEVQGLFASVPKPVLAIGVVALLWLIIKRG